MRRRVGVSLDQGEQNHSEDGLTAAGASEKSIECGLCVSVGGQLGSRARAELNLRPRLFVEPTACCDPSEHQQPYLLICFSSRHV